MITKEANVMRAVVGVFVLLISQLTYAVYEEREEVKVFIDDLVSEHQFDRDALIAVFAKAEQKESILKAIARPAEKRLEWAGYRKIFIKEDRIKRGYDFLKKYADTFARAEAEYGVPAEIIAAIIGVETRYGANKGSYRVVDALSTLAFDYPPRSKFFKSELKQVFLLAREQGFSVDELKGSYAGAMGFGQFIPSSYRHYAVDFDGDGVADILNNPVDAIGSVANYFVKHRWKAGEPVATQVEYAGAADSELFYKSLKPKHKLSELYQGGVSEVKGADDASKSARLLLLNADQGPQHWVTFYNFYVITRYNHSHLYAMAVFQLSEALRQK